MARGKKCPKCGYQLYAVDEEQQQKGSWVHYKCRSQNCDYEEKVFESK